MKTISSKIRLLAPYCKVFLSFSLFIFHFSFAVAQQLNIDSLFVVLKTAKEDTNKVNGLNKVAYSYYRKGRLKQSDSLARLALNIGERLSFKKGIERAYNALGNVCGDTGNIPGSLNYFNLSLKIATEIGDKRDMGNAYNNIGLTLFNQGNYPEALADFLECKKLAEETGQKYGLANAYGNIGNLYCIQGNTEDALRSYEKCLELMTQMNDKPGMGILYGNIGNIYQQRGNYDKALSYYRLAIDMDKVTGNRYSMGVNYGNMGIIYSHINKTDSALVCQREALKLQKQIKNKKDIAYVYQNLGSIYAVLKNYVLTKVYYDSAYNQAKEIDAKEILRDVYLGRAMLDSMQGNMHAAFDNYKLYIMYRDSLKNEASTKKLVSEQMQYEFAKKETRQKAEQDKKDAIAEQESNKQRLIKNAFIAGFMLVLALAFFIFRGYRQKQKANEIITKQKNEVENQKELVEEKQKEILDSIHYAQRIQKALLASDDMLKHNLQEHFVLFKPKDIVSGDFYWATNSNGRFYLAVCDSTGHGVPGAFMSLLNTSFLNEAINEKNITEPNEVFNHARKRLIENISQDGQQDGMDGTIASFAPSQNGAQLGYAAAYNTPIVIRNGELIELEADKMPVGTSPKENESFKLHSVSLHKGDCLYLFTDGFADQFGGEKGKKFKYKQLQQLIANNVQLTMAKQKEAIEKVFTEWQGGLEQTDDVCVIGIRI
jgi:serine phosphatase RsbU (regulator of sigma subunit)